MPRILLRQPWTCAKCLLRQQKGRRSLATAAAVATANTTTDNGFLRISHRNASTSFDDTVLRQIFDSRAFWYDFSKSQSQNGLRPDVGLFQNRYLKTPQGFEEFAQISIAKCRRIVDKVLGASTVQEYRSLARDLDRLSDLLCRIIDLSDFVRATHPDPTFQDAASQAHAFMFEYMNTLNTTTGLCEQLQKALGNPEVVHSWSEEEKTVAQILMKDFSQSAIDLPESKRQEFVKISNTINTLGFRVVDEMSHARSHLYLNNARLKGMDPTLLKSLTDSLGRVRLSTAGAVASSAIRHVEDEETRKAIYTANRTASRRQISNLETLLKLRAELANLSGYPSFSSMTLVDKMAKSPEAVTKFLEALSAENAPRKNQEIADLRALKAIAPSTAKSSDEIQAWDKDYFQAKLNASFRSATRTPDFLPAYFSLGTVMQGLSRLFTRLYGVRFVPCEILPGETWHPDVRRLDVIDESDGHIAVIYCDLFSRAGKNPNPAHFTLRCSRLISESEIAEAASLPSDPLRPLSSHQLANDGMAIALSPQNALYQLPTIALICDFPPPIPTVKSPQPPTLLTYRDLQTLFHEMGHAIHSILGRTALQNVSGTRCATDFAELPSVLMEHFAADASVLALFARHWETGQELPFEMVAEQLRKQRRGQGAEIEAQIILSALDQACHSSIANNKDFDSTATFHATSRRWGSLAEPAGTSWQGFFGHLVGYGGCYYSYLFDRAIAGKVWEQVFKGHVLERERGERFKQEVLKWGGSREGWECVAAILGSEGEGEGLEGGGEKAMERVGGWGVAD